MAPLVQALTRSLGCLLLLALVGGFGRPAAAEVNAPAAAWLDEDGSCSVDERTDMVVCGRELFAGLLDERLLTLRSDVCDELLEGLFDQQTCAPGDAGCHAMKAGHLAPRAPRVTSSSSGTAAAALLAALTQGDAGRDPVRWPPQARPTGRAALGPEPPPPRLRLG